MLFLGQGKSTRQIWKRHITPNMRVLAIPNSKVWIACFALLRQYRDVGLLFPLGFGEQFEKFRKGRVVGFLASIPPLRN